MSGEMEERLLGSDAGMESVGLRKRVWRETKLLWRIALPSIIFRVTSYGTLVVAQSFIGHLGELELAAYALVQTIFMRFIYGLLAGMSSATETLCGQAYGAGEYQMMGIYLQRSWIVDGAISTLAIPCLLLAGPILRLLGQEKDITKAAQTISPWFVPYVYSVMFCTTIQMYLQAQMKNAIVGILSTLSFVLELAMSWGLVTWLGFGIGGAMAALNVSGWAMVVAEFVYLFRGWCPLTWNGFSRTALLDLFPMLKLSISSGVMICIEFWYSSILVLMSGYTKDAKRAVSAFSICQYICTWEFSLCLGFMGAACVRVANELGRGDAEAAKFSIKVNLSISTIIGFILWVLCLVFGRKISYIFSNDQDIAESVSDLSPLLAFSILLNSVQPVLSGVAVGAGMQTLVAIVNLGSYYAVGIPLGVILAYVCNLGIKGLWTGMLCGVAVQTLILSCIIYRTDWEIQVKRANEGLRKWLLKPSSSSPSSSSPSEESDCNAETATEQK